MILVFGGTTEGRKAVETLEEAGSPYYYSTKGDGQQVELVHGTHLSGGMDVPQMEAFCREHDIRLLVDAAHPFAEELHRNLLLVARQIGTPLIRYDRIYPSHESLPSAIVWCKDYDEAIWQLEASHVDCLLALTGVNTIGRLRTYCEQHPQTSFRILHRKTSKAIASAYHFPEERLVYFNEELSVKNEEQATARLIQELHADAILTKESGLSGGFMEKILAAQQTGVRIFVVERPSYPPETPNPQQVQLAMVNGPHGLRRTVEQLLPEFYPLHSGLTTGTCATAAAVAAVRQLLHRQPQNGTHGQTPAVGESGQVPVLLPDGETIQVAVTYGDGYASCFKQAGDDPDVTNGIEVRAQVSIQNRKSNHGKNDEDDTEKNGAELVILGGEGVGTFTLPGFDFPPGSPAINKAPREMIRQNLAPFRLPLQVVISVPQGREVARKTFNPRLGIEGGISIIGVSGIVKPFSEEAFIESIRKCMQVAQASGSQRVVINSGAKSERFLKERYPELPAQAFVQYGNYIGETLTMAHELQIPQVTLGVMLGKAVKLAQGHLDTHSRRATMDLDFVGQLLAEAGISLDLSTITLARELWERIPQAQLQSFVNTVIGHCEAYCNPLFPNGTLTILLLDDNGHIYSPL